jgi:hypothetical protein
LTGSPLGDREHDRNPGAGRSTKAALTGRSPGSPPPRGPPALRPSPPPEGGDVSIKLEDQVLVTEDGHENLTRWPLDAALMG